MKRALLGVGLVVHGLAHGLPGAQAGAAGRSWFLSPVGLDADPLRWIVAALSALAMSGFVAAGFGLWGAQAFRRRWRSLALVATLASLALLALFWVNSYALVAVVIDGIVLSVLWPGPDDVAAADARPRVRHVPHALEVTGNVLAVAFVGWLGVVALVAPAHRFWGSTPAELAMALPGDEPMDGPPTYWIQHAVTIHAPADAVWPWLAQLGTNRGGFYSYDFLERAAGIDVHNADQLRPEWQHVHQGEMVVAAPPGYLGVDHPLGWELTLVEPGRAMVLENWGAFVLVPLDEHTTRFIVRTRNGQPPNPIGLTTSWLGLVTFEPIHFIMERGMLLGVKKRAERT